ncbi:MAG: NAD(P)H-dependent oxidoreductase subunit E [Defluviitaleaceae bacterium]|nr:NAD(P)H-dependent oxidoreductase subunit E [Defluviitaleaceae bacterium]
MSTATEATKYSELDEFIAGLPSNDGALIPALHQAQEIFGHLPFEVQNHIARKLRIPAAKVYGVVTFYSFFNIEPKGKYKVQVCIGTACFVRGAGKVLDEFAAKLKVPSGTTSEDMMWSLDGLRCVGACGLAPVVIVNGKVYGRVEVKDVQGIIDDTLAKGE